nr:cytochrome P450 4V2 [Helicoverpa armigera]WRX06012.1 CYP340K13 [Helicoverpa armigera]
MIGLILIFCVLCLVLLKYKKNRNKHELPPTSTEFVPQSLWMRRLWNTTSKTHPLPPAFPGALPIIGHLHKGISLSSNLLNFLQIVSDDCVKQGGVTVLNLGPELHYVITDPQDAALAAKSCLRRHYLMDFAKVWQGNGITTSSGETWTSHRKLLSPAFSLPVIHSFLDVFNSQAKKLIDELEPFVGKGPFDHGSYFVTNNFETLCAGTFGIENAISKNLGATYISAAYGMVDLLKAKAFKVWLQIDLIYKLVGLKKKEEQLVENLHSLAKTVIQKKKLARENEALSNNVKSPTSGLRYKGFLDLLMDLSADGALTDIEVRDQIEAILTTGFETTATQLTFTVLLLGAHPEIQEKMVKELEAVLGPDRDVGKDDLNKLVYTNAVIMESVRLFPTIPIILRCVDQDVKLKNFTMNAGSYCILFPLIPNIAAREMKEDQFRPERWLEDDFNGHQDFAGFGLGKRGCLGKTYAIIAMKVLLANFMRQYRVQADMSQLQLSADFVLKPVSGHEISIERRHSPAA